MSGADRDLVVSHLRVGDVLNHLDIRGEWRSHWLRSRSCAETRHDSFAFGVSRDGHWHCWSCDKGGDLLALLALGKGLDIRADFPQVLDEGAALAGVDLGKDFLPPAKPAPRARPPEPQLPPLADRIARAKRRAAWAWERLFDDGSLPETYLRYRGLDPAAVLARETVKATPLRLGDDLRHKLATGGATEDMATLWATMGTRRGTYAIVVPVRCVDGLGFVDLRCRRVEPLGDQPKVIGMVGNVTVAPAEQGKTRQLIGCYGDPSSIDSDLVVLTEGLMDYLTALQLFPNAQVLGAPDAGSLGILARHAAAALAARDNESRLLIVEQADPPRLNKATGKMIAGSADQAINEDPNAATKAAVRLMRSTSRVGWLYCRLQLSNGEDVLLDGKPVKDLNDLIRVKADIQGMVTWWPDLGGPTE